MMKHFFLPGHCRGFEMKRVLWGGVDKRDVYRAMDEISAFYANQLESLEAENAALRGGAREPAARPGGIAQAVRG